MGNGTIYIDIYDSRKGELMIKPFEVLVKELVACSMPLTFHIEALKCQSIIMRTAVAKKLKVFGAQEKNSPLGADVLLEDFEGFMPLETYRSIWGEEYENYVSILEKAVNDTEGIIIFFNNKPIDARFHMVCGGATENSENVDGNIVQYLRKVLCCYCDNTPYSFNYKDITIQDLQDKLGIQFPKESAIRTMEIQNILYDIHRDEEGRVIKLKVAGKEFEGKELVKLLGLNSTRFSWRPEKIRFFTTGMGDGVGLCQYGANKMAQEGKTAEEILKYYYTGINLKKIEIEDMKFPLKGKAIMIDAAHGGEKGKDNIGISGLREKDVNLDISNYLEKRLLEMGATVYMTRRTDEHIPVTERAKIANEISPDFFISIHQNYFKLPSISGTEIYYYRGDQEAQKLGEAIIKELTEKLNTTNRGVKTAEFYLLRDVKVSSLHIEVAYISNPQEEALLAEKAFKEKAAMAIADGIARYYGYYI